MDWNRIGLGVAIVALGLTGYYGWPFVVAWWKKRKEPAAPVVAAKPNADDAYKAVKTLCEYFADTGNTGGLAYAKNCGVCLFNVRETPLP